MLATALQGEVHVTLRILLKSILGPKRNSLVLYTLETPNYISFPHLKICREFLYPLTGGSVIIYGLTLHHF